MRRRAIRVGLATTALLAMLVGALVLWVHSDDARLRFEAVASDALHREVRVAALEVGWDRLVLHELTLSDPWSEDPALRAERGEFEVRWAALREGGLAGTLRAEQFSLQVRKRGRETNFHGIRRSHPRKRPLDIMLMLQGGEVQIHDEDRGETVRLDDVALVGRVQRADAQPVVGLDARAGVVVAHGISVFDVSVAMGLDAHGVQLEHLEARLGEGVVAADARLSFDAASAWSARVEANDVALRDELLPIVVAVFPGAAGVSETPEGRIAGRISLVAELEGSGFTRDSILRSLAGRLSVELDGVVLPPETAIVRIAALLGGASEPLSLDPLAIEASISGPWVRVDSVRSGGQPIALPFDGRVALDGRLDLDLDVLPLLRGLPRTHAWARKHTLALPVRIEGTTAEPVIRAPSAAAVAGALTGAWAERALGLGLTYSGPGDAQVAG